MSTGIITTFAGTGTASYSGDGGDASSATLNYPHGIGLDAAGSIIFIVYRHILCLYLYFHSSIGNVYIADRSNSRVRKVLVSVSYPR